MRKAASQTNINLTGFDDIFQPTVSAPCVQADAERVMQVLLEELHPPEFHPFQIREDFAMQRLVKSVEKYGVREPGLARPRADGGYELVAGNRRKRACEIAGLYEMPVIIRKMDDDEAAIAMVDSNLEQRELLYSEKAWAYRVKLEALNHRGVKSETPGELSVDVLCEQTGEKKNTIYRLVRLTELIPDLLDKVDAGTLKFNPAVELSYLSRKEQADVAGFLELKDMRPSLSGAKKLREAARSGEANMLTFDVIESIILGTKKDSVKENSALAKFSRYFPETYTQEQMEGIINDLLEAWRMNLKAAS